MYISKYVFTEEREFKADYDVYGKQDILFTCALSFEKRI